LVNNLDFISVISTALNSQLYHYLILEAKGNKEIIREKKIFDGHISVINELTDDRINIGFEGIFNFK
jgi:hypothetical protein